MDAVSITAVAAAAAAGAMAGVAAAVVARRRAATDAREAALAAAATVRVSAESEARQVVLAADVRAREARLVRRREVESGLRERETELLQRTTAVAAREAQSEAARADVTKLREAVAGIEGRIDAATKQRIAALDVVAGTGPEVRARLERVSGASAAALTRSLADAAIDEARAKAAQVVRLVDAGAADPEQIRSAKRLMGIAVGRFAGHYLTERHQGYVFLGPPRDGRPLIAEDALAAIGAVTGIRLSLVDGQDAVRLEGLDGVGREVARRSLSRLLRRPAANVGEVEAVTREMTTQLDREVAELGRKAFAALEIPKAHPDIVRLVGRLNWRTSFTQNQWKHAIEAGFLCGLMAEELRLDVKLARRAALMHDIGKALTHELDGSHAVIGADYARRLGEPEAVANAIGAHHTDEPFNSAYAFLVAAADAMSGARPGARRQSEDTHVSKIADLERISRGFRGVAEAFAVQGGREVRVYVNEERVDDLGAVRLSSEIAEAISRELTFPGQIKVTVIREYLALDTAG